MLKIICLFILNCNNKIKIKDKMLDLCNKYISQLACEQSDLQKMTDLIDDIEDINLIDEYGKTILHYACEYKNYNLIEALLNDESTDINLQDKTGKSALYYLFEYNSFVSTKFLMSLFNTDSAIDQEILDEYTKYRRHAQEPIYLYDESNQQLHTFNLFLSRKDIDLKLRDFDGNTILHILTILRKEKMVEILLSINNESINIKNEKGLTPLHVASYNYNINIVNLLINHKTKYELLSNIEILKFLLLNRDKVLLNTSDFYKIAKIISYDLLNNKDYKLEHIYLIFNLFTEKTISKELLVKDENINIIDLTIEKMINYYNTFNCKNIDILLAYIRLNNFKFENKVLDHKYHTLIKSIMGFIIRNNKEQENESYIKLLKFASEDSNKDILYNLRKYL